MKTETDTSSPALHPALERTWWVNLYPDGQFTGTLCKTRESALDRCTYTGETPDGAQEEVRIVPTRGDKYAEQLQQIADVLGMTYARGSALVERVRDLVREQNAENTMNIESSLKRDLAIDAAVHALIRLQKPTITNAEIQKLGRTESGTGYWTALLDEQPIATIHLDGPNRFTLTLAP